VSLTVIGMTAILYTLGVDLAWTAAGGFVVLMLLRRHAPDALWPRIDWTILLFFGGLFVVVEGLVRSGFTEQLLALFPLPTSDASVSAGSSVRLASMFLVGSNVVSNVPFILVIREHMAALPNPTVGWELLAMASTFAGNLTLLGSVANIIVAEAGREIGGLPFREHLKLGLPLSLLTTLIGALWVSWIAG
jgi:Na+/H+ antiporter NhaD/arsenite permease-like protein